MKVSLTKPAPKDGELMVGEIKQTINFAAEKLGLEQDATVEVAFVKESEIAQLNKKFRQIDAPTDVLSFPINQPVPANQKIIGTIVICLAVVKAKGENLEDVIKHGLLHLAGYDHETEPEPWNRAASLINAKY